jgi:hypothetical protein
MNRRFAVRMLFCIKTCWLIAACGAAQTVPPRTPASADAVISELARRSGTTEPELRALLSNCNESQQSMYFCAYRDLFAADLTVDSVASSKLRAFPSCADASPTNLVSARDSIETNCKKSAIETYGEGSMAPTAQATCTAIALTALADHIQHSDLATCVAKSE